MTHFLLGLLLSAASAHASSFPDMSDTHRATPAVEWLLEKNIVQGNPDGTFQPQKNLNRAELAKILVGAFGRANPAAGSCFPDVQATEWYATYVCAAKVLGIVEGYPDGTFKPSKNVTVVEAAKMIGKVIQIDMKQAAGDAWYGPAMRYLEGRNALPDTVFFLDEELNRGEMAIMMHGAFATSTAPTTTFSALQSHMTPTCGDKICQRGELDGTETRGADGKIKFIYGPAYCADDCNDEIVRCAGYDESHIGQDLDTCTQDSDCILNGGWIESAAQVRWINDRSSKTDSYCGVISGTMGNDCPGCGMAKPGEIPVCYEQKCMSDTERDRAAQSRANETDQQKKLHDGVCEASDMYCARGGLQAYCTPLGEDCTNDELSKAPLIQSCIEEGGSLVPRSQYARSASCKPKTCSTSDDCGGSMEYPLDLCVMEADDQTVGTCTKLHAGDCIRFNQRTQKYVWAEGCPATCKEHSDCPNGMGCLGTDRIGPQTNPITYTLICFPD